MPVDMPVGKHDKIWPTGVPADMPVGVSTVMPVGEVSPTGESTRQLLKPLRQLAVLLFTNFYYQCLAKVSNVQEQT